MAPVTQPLQEILDSHHAVLTEQAKAINELRAQVAALAALAQPPAPNRALKRAVEDLGCRPNDPSFDNATILQLVLDNRIGIEFDGGGLFYTSPLKIRPGAASPLVGASCGFRHGSPSCTGLAPFKADQTHLLEITGVAGVDATPTSPAIAGGAGVGQAVRDLYFAGSPTCDGLRIHGGDAVSIERCVFRNCRRGILIQPTIRLYGPSVRSCGIYGCDVGYQIENGASVCAATLTATPIIGGRLGVNAIGWRRGLTLTGVVCEAQTETCFRFEGSKASLVGCYAESIDDILGLWVGRKGYVNVQDSSIRVFAVGNESQVNWIGDNVQSRTVAYVN